MGCSSCQQNNHIVPSVIQPNSSSLCECACGCAEPVCPTPQPCTEITDSKCIIYTDAVIKCGVDNVVTTNASLSTALNQLAAYFCTQIATSVSNYKYVHETTSGFAGDTVSITRSQLETCGVVPLSCSTDVGFVNKMCDLQVQIYMLQGATWVSISNNSLVEIEINNVTGNIDITFNQPAIIPDVAVRIVIMA